MSQQQPPVKSENREIDKAMTVEQFEQVVELIATGKYSWACVLILRIAGYNPLHYIPYRTYRRLVKENSQIQQSFQETTVESKQVSSH